jgi:hypothetical protein
MLIADELARQGHEVFESLSVSETLSLAEQHPDAHIIIASDVDPERTQVIQQHYPTMTLKPHATITDILWELQTKGATIQ